MTQAQSNNISPNISDDDEAPENVTLEQAKTAALSKLYSERMARPK